jgi:hypothetical protein
LKAASAHRLQLGILIETDNLNCECYFLTGYEEILKMDGNPVVMIAQCLFQ